MADANAVNIQRFRNDDVINPRLREPALFGQVGNAPESAGFLVDGA